MYARSFRSPSALVTLAGALCLLIPGAFADGPDHSSPEALLRSFVEMVNSKQTEGIEQIFHPDEREMAAMMVQNMPEGKLDFELIEQHSQEDWAVLRCKLLEDGDGNVDNLLFARIDGNWHLVFGFTGEIEPPDWIKEKKAAWDAEAFLNDDSILPVAVGEPLDVTLEPDTYPVFRFEVLEAGFVDINIEKSDEDAWLWASLYSADMEYLTAGKDHATGVRIVEELQPGHYRLEVGVGSEGPVAASFLIKTLPAGELPDGFVRWDGAAPAEFELDANQVVTYFLDLAEAGNYALFTTGSLLNDESGSTPSFSLDIDSGTWYGWGIAAATFEAGSLRIAVTNDGYESARGQLGLIPLDAALGDAPVHALGASQAYKLAAGKPVIARVEIPSAGTYVLSNASDAFLSQVTGGLLDPTGYFDSTLNGELELEAGSHVLIVMAQGADAAVRMRIAEMLQLEEGVSVSVLVESGMPVPARFELGEERKLIVHAKTADAAALTLNLQHEWTQLKNVEGGMSAELSMTVPAGSYQLQLDLGWDSNAPQATVELAVSTAEPEPAVVPEGAIVVALGADKPLAVALDGDEQSEVDIYFELTEAAGIEAVVQADGEAWVEMQLLRGEFPIGWPEDGPDGQTRQFNHYLEAGAYHIKASCWETVGLSIWLRKAGMIALGETLACGLVPGQKQLFFFELAEARTVTARLVGSMGFGELELLSAEGDWIAQAWREEGDDNSLEAELDAGMYQLRISNYQSTGFEGAKLSLE